MEKGGRSACRLGSAWKSPGGGQQEGQHISVAILAQGQKGSGLSPLLLSSTVAGWRVWGVGVLIADLLELYIILVIIVINCHLFQKINFAGILITYFNQFAKNGYDAYAESFLSLMLTEDKDQIADNNMTVAMEKATYIDMSNLFIFNQVVMFVDSFLICMAAISLLKYTSMANPDIECIINTVGAFTSGTVRKTMLMIFLTYMLFGQMCNYILCYY